MTTAEFSDFLKNQEFDRATTRRLSDAVEKLTADVAQMHASRHAVQENLAIVVGEMRLDHSNLEQQVSKLVTSMRELVIAMEGNYGSAGLVARLAAAEKRVDACERLITEGQGMRRLLGWGGAIIGAAVAIKALFVK